MPGAPLARPTAPRRTVETDAIDQRFLVLPVRQARHEAPEYSEDGNMSGTFKCAASMASSKTISFR